MELESTISIQDGKLMLLVLKNEELYDLSNPNFTNAKRRETIWGDIAKAMKRPVNWCRDRWEQLRLIHRNAVKLLQTKVDDVPPEKTDTNLSRNFGSMFPTVCGSDLHKVEEIDAESNEGGEAIDINEIVPIVKSSDSNVTFKTGISCEKPQESHNTKISLIHILQQFLDLKKKDQDKDPLIRFFVSMAIIVKDFPLQDQVEIRGKVFDLVHSVEKRIVCDENKSPEIREIANTDKRCEVIPIPSDLFKTDSSLRSFMSEFINPEPLLEQLNKANKTMGDNGPEVLKSQNVAQRSVNDNQTKQQKITVSEPTKPAQRDLKSRTTSEFISHVGTRPSIKGGHDNKPKKLFNCSFNDIHDDIKKSKRKREHRNNDLKPIIRNRCEKIKKPENITYQTDLR